MNQDERSSKEITLQIDAATHAHTVESITIWLSHNFAPEWFADALNEAKTGQSHNSRRREIIFGVCCAESYLLEWVLHEVLDGEFRKVINYFPPDSRRGVFQKWKDVPKQLHDEGLTSGIPNYGESWWKDWRQLVWYRDGLVHASSSRPETISQLDKENPLPSKTKLDQLPPGWAVRTVITLVRNLHKAVGTTSPAWLIEP